VWGWRWVFKDSVAGLPLARGQTSCVCVDADETSTAMDHKSGGNYKTKSSGFDEWLIVARAEQIGRLRSAHGEL
jgi:hypothetical protein